MRNSTVLSSESSVEAENSRFMSRVYRWMTLGILITGVVSYFTASSQMMLSLIFQNVFVFWGLIILQLGSVFFLASAVNRISATMTTFVFLLYATLTGLTLSTIFVIYAADSIQSTFFVTSFSFAGLSAFGYFTKRDLGPIGTFCHMGLWGLIGFGILTLFFPSMMTGANSNVYAIVGILIFAGLTAYDTQKIKSWNVIGSEGTDENHKAIIMGALTLYLDFINLFLKILRLLGRRRR